MGEWGRWREGEFERERVGGLTDLTLIYLGNYLCIIIVNM